MTVHSDHRPSTLLDTLERIGIDVAVTVPDGWLGELLVQIEERAQITLIRATHEEEALAIACGARLGGKRSVLVMQNVGLLCMGAGMVALADRYRFPLLMIASYRGTPDDPVFYHIPKGRVTEPVLNGFGVDYAVCDPGRPINEQVISAATYAEESSAPFVLLMRRRDVEW